MSENLFDKCLAKWGLNSQILMLAEEAGELSVATLHLLRDKKRKEALNNFAEEIADVELMLQEIKYYLNISDLIKKYRKQKIERLEALLNE